MSTARGVKRYTCYGCKDGHAEDNMAAYCAACYDVLRSKLSALEAENKALSLLIANIAASSGDERSRIIATAKSHPSIEQAKAMMAVVEAAKKPCGCSRNAIGNPRKHDRFCPLGEALKRVPGAK